MVNFYKNDRDMILNLSDHFIGMGFHLFELYFLLQKMSRENYDLTGQKIQGYTISKPIGQGKFSIVYRAENQQGEPFALKKIKIFDMADQRQREKCLREVDIMKKLNHPHIIQYIDSFIHNNELIIVTEWAERGDLKKLIKEKQSDELQFDEPTIWTYMKQISSALQHMHEKRIMHRDLKPANIFISQDNSLKIGDLGLGRSFSSQTLEAYSKVGTPLYMSPELIQDSGYTENADVWSLGCICYELAELKSPFRNKEEKMSLMDLFDNITKCNYKPLEAKYSPQLREAIQNMVVVDPTKRWSSEQVYSYACRCLEDVKKPLLDPFIAMDDIYIKLTLLNYEASFCKAAERKPINRLYFALEDQNPNEENGQLNYFLELAYWIMALSKPDKKKDKLAVYTKTLIDWSSAEAACKKLLSDLSDYGLKGEDGIAVNSIRNQGKGYGEGVCYLLNQILTRELIRMNFQFKAPADSKEATRDDFQEMSPRRSEREIQEEDRKASEESLQQQSQFEQSILFNKNNRKDRQLQGLIDKIEQLEEEEENRMMIVGRVDEREWKAECLRLEKKLADIGTSAKDARKKGRYIHAETARISQAKLNDLVKFVKPATSTMFRAIDSDLEKIIKGEQRLKSTFQNSAESYSQRNQETLDLNNRASNLSNWLRDQSAALEKTEELLSEMNKKIKTSTLESSEENKVSLVKGALVAMKKEIIEMDQKRQILSWELRNCILREQGKGKDDYLEINYFEDES